MSIVINPATTKPPTRDNANPPTHLPVAKTEKQHPSKAGGENASVYFVGTATTILILILPQPNFLHAGDHVHLGPGVSSTRLTNPSVDLHDLPRIDLVLLSHYHADHFDQEVEESLRRDLPIISTTHAKKALSSKGDDSFTNVHDLEPFQELMIDVKDDKTRKQPRIRVTGMPGKHVAGAMEILNEYVSAIPPTNGWMVELGYENDSIFKTGYRIYISGDTLMVNELKEIPKRYPNHPIDLMLIHLGGTTVPSPKMLPLAVMVTMDAKQGVELMRLIKPDVTIPIHFDDYDVFASPLEDFQKLVQQEGLGGGVVYLDRGEKYQFFNAGIFRRCSFSFI
ncbi:lactamase [Cryptococcus gattii Ru294]|nr:lactamase [Cryptococcus gattii Ru294]